MLQSKHRAMACRGKGFAVVAAEIKKLAEKISACSKKKSMSYPIRVYFHARENWKHSVLKLFRILSKQQFWLNKSQIPASNKKTSSEEINAGIQQLNKVTQQNAGILI